MVGWIAAVEVTHEGAGFHPHLHVVVLFDTPMSADMVAELGGRWFQRFQRALVRRGFSALEFSGGLDARTVDADSSGAIGGYLSKLALEVTSATTKTARRRSSRTMWQVLADGLATGFADDLEALVRLRAGIARPKAGHLLPWPAAPLPARRGAGRPGHRRPGPGRG